VRAGEPLTDARLVTSSLLDGYPGLVAVPVRIGDAGAVRLLRVGDRVDVLAADTGADHGGRGTASVVGRDVPVLAIPRPGDDSPGLVTGALVVLGLPESGARTVAQASVTSFLSVVLTG
jgi:Flp pilus assembly protein CpaB